MWGTLLEWKRATEGEAMREYISAIHQPRLGVSCRVLGISAFKCLPSPHYNGTRWHMAGCAQSANT